MTQIYEGDIRVYDALRTAVLVVDPYNDFLADGGKLWPLIADVAKSVKLHENLSTIINTARVAGLPIFIVPHHRSEPDDLKHWDHPTPFQRGSERIQAFAKGSWGGEWYPEFAPERGDIIVKEHWGSSGFANTDLDLLLKQKSVTHIILIGVIANTCIECTARFGSEIGYHVTLVRDATAAASADAMHAAHELNGPSFAHSIVTTAQLTAALREMNESS